MGLIEVFNGIMSSGSEGFNVLDNMTKKNTLKELYIRFVTDCLDEVRLTMITHISFFCIMCAKSVEFYTSGCPISDEFMTIMDGTLTLDDKEEIANAVFQKIIDTDIDSLPLGQHNNVCASAIILAQYATDITKMQNVMETLFI